MNISISTAWASMLFLSIMLMLMYAIPLPLFGSDLREFPLIALAVLAIPYSISQWNRREILALLCVYTVSLIATGIAMTRFSDALGEYVKACIMLAIAHATSYLIYTFTLSFDPAYLRRLLMFYCFVLIGLCILEVASSDFAALSGAVSNRLNRDASAIGDAAYHESRDIMLHGGIRRPLVFSQEPSFPAVSLAISLVMISALTAQRTGTSLFNLTMPLVSTVVTRSPSFLAVYLSGIFARVFSRARLGQLILLAFLGVVMVGAAYKLLEERLNRVLSGSDMSFKVRTICPVMLVPATFSETSGLYGLGIIGSIHDGFSHSLDKFLPIWVKTIRWSDAEALFSVAKHQNLPIGFFPAMTHWAYFGIPLGLISCYCWYRFYAIRQGRAAICMFLFFCGFSFAYGGYTMIRLHAYTFLVAASYAAAIHREQAVKELEQFPLGE